jgi:hypothetical protein
VVSGAAIRVRVDWPRTYRIIRSIYPPIDLFEDIADPADWEAITAADAKVNGAMSAAVGDLSKVPVARRVAGAGASWVMAPFVHCSTLRPGRFTDGSYGIYYAGDSVMVALAETIHHHQVLMAATAEEPGWTSDFRVLVGSIDHELDKVDAVPGVRDPVNYGPSQVEGAARRAAGSDGDSYDNALAETINGLFKAEVIQGRGPWRNFEAVEYATLEWTDWFNNRRLLEPIGNIPPAEAEANFYAALETEDMAA